MVVATEGVVDGLGWCPAVGFAGHVVDAVFDDGKAGRSDVEVGAFGEPSAEYAELLWEDLVASYVEPDDVSGAYQNLFPIGEGGPSVWGPRHLPNPSVASDLLDSQAGAEWGT